MLILLSCTEEKVDRSVFIQEEVERRVVLYKLQKKEKCEEQLLDEINIEVDSMMYFLVQKMKGMTNEMPNRPDRPGRLVDTINLEDKPEY